MGAVRHITTGILGAALLATSATPALADPWGHGGGWGHGERRDHDHDHVGGIIAGVVGLGILAAIVSSASSSHDNQAQYPRDDYPRNPPPPPVTQGYAGQGYPQPTGVIASENDAVDMCASATEQQAGRFASVRDIKKVKSSDKGWEVQGVVEQRASYRDNGSNLHDFKCTVRYGAVQGVRIDD